MLVFGSGSARLIQIPILLSVSFLHASTGSFEPQGILNQALQDQNAIGWTIYYKGRLSEKWEQVQKTHYHPIKAKKADPYKWATSVITAMWQAFLQMWENRKDDQHGRDANKETYREREVSEENKVTVQTEGIDRPRRQTPLPQTCRSMGK